MATTYDEDGGLSVTRYCGPYNGGDRTRYQIDGLVIRRGVVSVNQHDAEVLVRTLQRAIDNGPANQSEDESPAHTNAAGVVKAPTAAPGKQD